MCQNLIPPPEGLQFQPHHQHLQIGNYIIMGFQVLITSQYYNESRSFKFYNETMISINCNVHKNVCPNMDKLEVWHYRQIPKFKSTPINEWLRTVVQCIRLCQFTIYTTPILNPILHIYTTGARLEQLEVVLMHPFLNLACAVMSTNCGNLIGGPTGVLLLWYTSHHPVTEFL